MTPKYRTALFAGTFNPFTIGHLSIVERTLKLCDRIIIAFGCNIEKPDTSVDERMAEVKRIFAGNDQIEIRAYSGLTVDFARECGADFLVRGVRNTLDFEYERTLAETNLKLSGIETVLLPTLPELSYVSSSMVRELKAAGRDVSEFLPK